MPMKLEAAWLRILLSVTRERGAARGGETRRQKLEGIHLQRAESSALLIVQSALDGFVQPARGQVRLDAAIERGRACELIEPQPQFLQLLLRQRSNRALEFFHFSSVHVLHPHTELNLRNTIIALSRMASGRTGWWNSLTG